MTLVIGNDHAALSLKCELADWLKGLGYKVINVGTDSNESTDYPIYASLAAQYILRGEAEYGLLICGTGIGMSLAANAIPGIRAAAVSEPYSAKMAKEHNNANVLTLGARAIGPDMAKMIVSSWLDASFQGGRHQNRLDLIYKKP